MHPKDSNTTMPQGPVVGRLFDMYGPRWLIIGGSCLHVFGLMMASISTEYYQVLLSQGVCSAIGVAAIFQSGKSILIISWLRICAVRLTLLKH
jgi:MFS family permease